MTLVWVFLSAFGAATILPFYSELLVLGALKLKYSAILVWCVATLGNTLGAGVNWFLGRFFLHWRDHPRFPFKQPHLAQAQSWYAKWGKWSLLFAWLPIGGDALTFIAGAMRLHALPFFLLTAIGKGVRYALLIAAYFGLVEFIELPSTA